VPLPSLPEGDTYQVLPAPYGNGKLYISPIRSAAYDWWPGRTRVRLNTKTDAGVIEQQGYCTDIDIAESVCEIWVLKGEVSKNFHEATEITDILYNVEEEQS